ncbi:MAG: carbon-nitrogen hydrolase [Planctomycetota bacterium]
MTADNDQRQTVSIGAIQLQCGHDPNENKRKTIEQIRHLKSQGAEIICLQELFATRYFCQSECHEQFNLADSIPGLTTEQFSKIADELRIVLIISLFERRAPGLYHNTAVVFDTDGSLAGKYRKMHIPDDPGFYEKFYFTPGDTGFQMIPTSKGQIGVCICWDQWFPEAARLTALAGADVIFYPTAIGWLLEEKSTFGPSQLDSWKTMMRSHAIANGVFVVAPNRVGIEDNIEFWGHSLICDPYGTVIQEAGEEEGNIIAECDFQLIETARTHWPFLRDRRIDAYQKLNQRFIDDPEPTHKHE